MYNYSQVRCSCPSWSYHMGTTPIPITMLHPVYARHLRDVFDVDEVIIHSQTPQHAMRASFNAQKEFFTGYHRSTSLPSTTLSASAPSLPCSPSLSSTLLTCSSVFALSSSSTRLLYSKLPLLSIYLSA